MNTISNVLFVGNIDLKQKEQVLNLFTNFGTVLSFTCVINREYGFCEYKEQSSAFNAMRSLNGKEYNGRILKIDFAENKGIRFPNDVLEEKLCIGTEIVRDSLLQIPKSQIIESLSLIKQLLLNDPDHVKNILIQNPTLTLVILYSEAIIQQSEKKQVNNNNQITQLLKNISPEQLKHILNLTPKEIEQLPLQQRQQIYFIQQETANLAKGLLK